MSMSLCRWRSVSEVRRSLPMVDLSTVLILFRPLNDLSAEQEVTGRCVRVHLYLGKVKLHEVGCVRVMLEVIVHHVFAFLVST